MHPYINLLCRKLPPQVPLLLLNLNSPRQNGVVDVISMWPPSMPLLSFKNYIFSSIYKAYTAWWLQVFCLHESLCGSCVQDAKYSYLSLRARVGGCCLRGGGSFFQITLSALRFGGVGWTPPRFRPRVINKKNKSDATSSGHWRDIAATLCESAAPISNMSGTTVHSRWRCSHFPSLLFSHLQKAVFIMNDEFIITEAESFNAAGLNIFP